MPSTITMKLLSKFMDEMAHNTSSSAVRCELVDGMIYLLDNQKIHELLKILLPRLAPLIHNHVMSVRIVVVDLLLLPKDIRALQFHKLCPLFFIVG